VILRRGTDTVTVAPGARATFGRSTETDLPVGADPVDHRVSRRAGEVRFDGGTWIVVNTGRRSLFLVEPAGETELSPGGAGRSEVPVVYDGCWVRVPGHGVDHAVELDIPATERPAFDLVSGSSSALATAVEATVTLTTNELRSVLAVYESYLALPPHYAFAASRLPGALRCDQRSGLVACAGQSGLGMLGHLPITIKRMPHDAGCP
jgi:hypothetical protein